MKRSNSASSKKGKYPGFRNNVHGYFTDFSENTGIHGFKYMGEQNRTIFEKIFWVILFCVSLCFCINLIMQIWIKWDTSPVLVSFARSPTPVWKIPFPSVTICPETKTRLRKFNITDIHRKYMENNITEDELHKLSNTAIVCDFLYHEGNKTADYKTIDYLMSIAPQFSDTLVSCNWLTHNDSCDNLFTPHVTDEGLCFTFNMLDKSELVRNNVFLHGKYMYHVRKSKGWTLEKGYPKRAKKDTFPRRALSAGSNSDLDLILTAYKQDLDYLCKESVHGFKILLHHPAEIPRLNRKYLLLQLNQEMVVSVKPDMLTTSEGLRDYDPMRRQCFFSNERKLAFYKSYTQKNCQIECLANATLASCGCVAYYMPYKHDLLEYFYGRSGADDGSHDEFIIEDMD